MKNKLEQILGAIALGGLIFLTVGSVNKNETIACAGGGIGGVAVVYAITNANIRNYKSKKKGENYLINE